MDQTQSKAAAPIGDPDGQRDPAFCDCGQVDLSAILAACSPESLARLREPIGEPFLQLDLQYRRSPESQKSPCALFRCISRLYLWSEHFLQDFGFVEVRIFLSSSSSRAAADVDPYLKTFSPFLLIAFAPGSPPGKSAGWSEYKEFAIPSAYSTELGLPAELTRGLKQRPTWEVHNECALKEKPNWEGIKTALSICRTKHIDSCGRVDPQLEGIPGLLVIDCTTRCLVPFPDDMVARGAEYATLSYVWGLWGAASKPPNISPGSPLPTALPLVVEDAISACLQIGIQYLWVDRYCIRQDDAEAKHAQIRNMNLIYKQSALTLIDAVGSNPTHGLPGVSRPRPLPKRTRLRVGPHDLVPIIKDAQLSSKHDSRIKSFAESTWNSRGWTYQEAVVSRRRLIFTKHLVLFQCWESKWDERFSSPVSTTPVGHLGGSFGVPQFFPHGPIGFDASDFGHHATEYFGRQFTYISDQLVAFQGILREFYLSPAAVQHFCAVPVYRLPSSLQPVTPGRRRQKSRSRLIGKLKSLLDGNASVESFQATPSPVVAGFVPGLCWSLEPKIDSGVRVSIGRNEAAGLPSWSWMGWRAASRAYKVSFPLDRAHAEFKAGDFPDNYNSLVQEIQVGFGPPGKEGRVPNDTESPLDIAVNLRRLDAVYLRITAWVFQARYMQRPAGDTPIDGYDRAPYHAILIRTDQTPDEPYIFDLVQPRDKRGLASQSATFVVMFSLKDGSHTVCLALQPCAKHGNGKCFERIGLLHLHRQVLAYDEVLERHSPSNWKPGSKEKMFMESLPSEVCRMTSVYVC